MNYLNGGYVMLDKADSDIFAKASGALQAGKPILWYEDKNTCYFIDTIEKTGSDSIALTKGGLTIVITSGNVVTELGDIQNHLYQHSLTITASDGFTVNANVLVKNNETIDTSTKLFALMGIHNKIIANGYSASFGDGGGDVMYILYDDADTFEVGIIDIDAKSFSEERLEISSITDTLTQLF